jgi:hypothetical protein
LPIACSHQRIDKIIQAFDQGGVNALNFGQFPGVFNKELQLGGTKSSRFAEGLRKHSQLVTVPAARGVWAWSQQEVEGFAGYINKSLEQDAELKGLLPIDGPSDGLFMAVHNEILLCKLCNLSSPDALDELVIATGRKLDIFSRLANLQTEQLHRAQRERDAERG